MFPQKFNIRLDILRQMYIRALAILWASNQTTPVMWISSDTQLCRWNTFKWPTKTIKLCY